jgi:hypothetical protein
MDQNEAEIRAAFESYAKLSDDMIFSTENLLSDGLIHSSDLRSAFIQLMNCHISQGDVHQALLEEGYQNIGNCYLALEDFRFLYRIMIEMNMTPGEGSWDRQLNVDVSPSYDDNSPSYSFSPLSTGAMEAHNKRGQEVVSPLSTNNNAFWRSPTGTYVDYFQKCINTFKIYT